MAILAMKSSKADLIPEGAYPARIYQIIHVGTVPGFEGQLQNKTRITFEFPTEKKVFDENKGEQPRVLSQAYTLSFGEKANLRKVINACDPKGLKTDVVGFVSYDIENLIGKECLITVGQREKKNGEGKYNFVEAVTILPKGMECPAQINPSKILNYTKFDWELFKALPEFVRKEIEGSEEFKKLEKPKEFEYPKEDIKPSEIPF